MKTIRLGKVVQLNFLLTGSEPGMAENKKHPGIAGMPNTFNQ
jgi:hypothetical protein